MTQNKKHIKGSPEWISEITTKVGKKVEEVKEDKKFAKGEKKPDGTIVTKDEGETIKVTTVEAVDNDVKKLFEDITAQKKVAKDKLEELNRKVGGGDELALVYREIDVLDRILYTPAGGSTHTWKDNLTNYVDYYKKFLGDGTGTNEYRTDGWKKIQEDYYKKQFVKADGTLGEDYTNLYEFATPKNHGWEYWKTTEQEVIKLMTRTIAELKKIKPADWTAFTNDTAECDLGSSPTVKDRSNATTPKWDTDVAFTRTDLQTWMTSVQGIALVDNEIKDDSGNGTGKYANGKRLEYSFAQDHTNHGTNVASGTRLTPTQLRSFFNLIDALGGRVHYWKDKAKFKTVITNAGIADKTDLILLPVEMEKDTNGNLVPKPVAESKLKEWGITGYTVTNGKTNYYLTDYGTKLSDYNSSPFRKSEFNWDSKKDIHLENGLKGWTDFMQGTIWSGGGGTHFHNERKLMSSLVADPVSQLFQDARTTDPYGKFTESGNNFTLLNFPDTFALAEKRYYELKARRKRLLNNGADQEAIDKLNEEYETAKTDLTAKENELQGKIDAQITKIRTNLKTKFAKNGIGVGETYKGFKKTASEDNRIKLSDLCELKYTLTNIRYLENADEEADSSVANENSALTEINELWDDLHPISINATTPTRKKIEKAKSFLNYGQTDAERIEGIKEFVEGSWQLFSWQDIVDGFDEIEKLIIMPKNYDDSRMAIKTHMNKQPGENPETLSDWQTKLKILDPLLTETIVTEDKKKDFEKHNNFKKSSEVVGLIRKVLDEEGTAPNITYKVKKDFIDNYLVKEDAEVDDLAKMITKLSAEKIIKLIKFYEYEKETAEKQKELRRKFSWDQNKKVGEKYVGEGEDYTLAETDKEDFQKFLYELATGAKTLNSISKPTERQEDNQKTPTDKKGHFAENWVWYVIGGVVLTGIIGATIYFWDKIKTLWEPKEEEDNE